MYQINNINTQCALYTHIHIHFDEKKTNSVQISKIIMKNIRALNMSIKSIDLIE